MPQHDDKGRLQLLRISISRLTQVRANTLALPCGSTATGARPMPSMVFALPSILQGRRGCGHNLIAGKGDQ